MNGYDAQINSFFGHIRPDMLKDSRFLSKRFGKDAKKADKRKATCTCRPQTTPKANQLDGPYLNNNIIAKQSSKWNKNVWTKFGQFWIISQECWSMDANGHHAETASHAAEVHFTEDFTGVALLICNQQVTGSSPVAGSIF